MTPKPPSFWRRWHEAAALVYQLAVALVVSAGALWLLRCFDDAASSSRRHIDRVFACKLTFLSLVFAAFAVWYSYFLQMRWTEGQKVRAGDIPLQRQTRQLLTDAKASGRTDPAFEQ